MTTNGKSSHGEERKAKDLVDKILSDVGSKGKTLLNEGLGSAKEVFESNADAIKEKASELSDKTLDEIGDDVKYLVRKHPLQSMGIALGVGFVLGSLFGSD